MKKYKINRKFYYDGEPYYIHADTETEYNKKYHKKMMELETQSIISDGNISLKLWSQKCVPTYKSHLKHLEKYENKVQNYVLKYIGDMRLKNIKPIHCQDTLNQRRGDSKTAINDTYQILNFLFEKAKANGMIRNNPAKFLAKPTGITKRRRSITDYEREHIIKVCTKTRKYYLYLLMLFCSCRPEEAAECMGNDIDTIKGYNVLHIRGTKSDNADRWVPIPDFLYDIIKNTPDNEYIACYRNGNKIKYENRNRVWKSCIRELNLSMGCKTYRNRLLEPYPLADDLVPYCLRHTYCTDLARKGIDIRIAQKLMGHSDISLTANIYTDLNDMDMIIAAAKLLK